MTTHGRPVGAAVGVTVMLVAAATSLAGATATLVGARLLPMRLAPCPAPIAVRLIALATTASMLVDVGAVTAITFMSMAGALPRGGIAVTVAACAASAVGLPLAARAATWGWAPRGEACA